MAALQMILNDIASSPVDVVMNSPVAPVLILAVAAACVLLIRILFAKKQ